MMKMPKNKSQPPAGVDATDMLGASSGIPGVTANFIAAMGMPGLEHIKDPVELKRRIEEETRRQREEQYRVESERIAKEQAEETERRAREYAEAIYYNNTPYALKSKTDESKNTCLKPSDAAKEDLVVINTAAGNPMKLLKALEPFKDSHDVWVTLPPDMNFFVTMILKKQGE
jgi:hypothetical protein